MFLEQPLWIVTRDVLAKYASDHLKAKQVVLFYDNSSDYSKGIAKRFKKVYTDTIVAEATFQSGDTDFQSALTKLKDKEYDAIVMPVLPRNRDHYQAGA